MSRPAPTMPRRGLRLGWHPTQAARPAIIDEKGTCWGSWHPGTSRAEIAVDLAREGMTLQPSDRIACGEQPAHRAYMDRIANKTRP